MKKIITLVLLLLPTIVHAQFTEQIDSIKLVGTIDDSLVFIVHSTINGGAIGVDTDGNPVKLEEVEYIEEDNILKVNILYSQVLIATCYCPVQTIIKIKKDVYTKAVVEVMRRMICGGTETNPEFGNYMSVDIKEIDLLNMNIDNYPILSNITVFPNPVQNVFHISLGENRTANLEIYSIQGNLLLNKGITSEQGIDVSFLYSGLYFIVIDKKYVYKIIKE